MTLTNHSFLPKLNNDAKLRSYIAGLKIPSWVTLTCQFKSGPGHHLSHNSNTYRVTPQVHSSVRLEGKRAKKRFTRHTMTHSHPTETAKFRGELMARINVEDQFFDDVAAVGARMGDVDRAAGQAIRLIRFAQLQVKAGKRVTYQEFTERFSEHLMPEFARRDGDFVIIRGAAEHFKWLQKKSDAGSIGGKKSGEVRRSKTKQPKAKRSKPKQTEPSSSFSSSSSSSDSSTSSSNENPTDSKPQAFVAAYCRGFKARWGVNPDIQGKDAGIAGRLAKSLSFERYEYLLGAFFQMPDAQLVKWKHPISAFEMKLNEVVVFADSGQFTTRRQAQQADDMASNHMLMEKLKREGK